MPLKRVAKKPMRKAMTKKSSYTKQKANPVARVTNSLATVAIHHNKLLGSLFDTLYFEAKACREFELSAIPSGTTCGKMDLTYSTATLAYQQFPLHVYDLTMLATQDGVNTVPLQRTLVSQSNIMQWYNFASPQLTCIGGNDGSAFSSNQNLNKTLQEYANVRVDLYQRNQYSSEYTMQLIKFNDEDLCPEFNNANIGNSNYQQFWKTQVRPQYTNSLVPTDPRIDNDLKGKYNILWEKHYKLKEKLNDCESFTCKRVNIFKKLNKVLRYNENPTPPTFTGDDPEAFTSVATTGSSSTQTRIKDRIYLIIKGAQTLDSNTAAGTTDGAAVALTDIHSYNIYIKTKHVTPQAGV